LALDDVQKAIGENDVRLYGFVVDNVKTLRRLVADTGGRTWSISNAAEISAATARLADELRHQYLLGYATLALKNGQRHAIKVDVRERGHVVAVRRGFVAE
jgi:hypothetical protein